MSKWEFYFQPNIWGNPEEPGFSPFFSRSEVIEGYGTIISIIHASDLVNIPVEGWYDYMENIWNKFKEDNVASAQSTN